MTILLERIGVLERRVRSLRSQLYETRNSRDLWKARALRYRRERR